MHHKIPQISRSVSFKVVLIGLMVMVLLIPVGMIKDVINDRQMVSHQAERDISQSWGGQQLVAAPILVLPYEGMEANQYGRIRVSGKRLYVLPETLDIDVELRPQIRYRGIHEVPIYSSIIRFSGSFAMPDAKALTVDASQVDWDELSIAIGVSDARAILKTPVLKIGDQSRSFVAGGLVSDGLPPQIVAPIQNPFNEENGYRVSFSFEMSLNGTRSLEFLPMGDTSSVTISSSWASPSFSGAYLPVTREISEDGFTASWEISSLGRSMPSVWREGELSASALTQSAFGVDIYLPVGLYQLTLRATRYAVLFIGLTFVAYFLFEVMAGLRLHLLQYLMIGFANTLFYLLLLSLAEHIGFGWSYIVSAIASASLIIGYSKSALKYRYQVGLMSVVMLCLYSFLYMTLRAETYALLFGSMGLWASLAIIMFLTRRVDWFGNGPSAVQERWAGK
jgi:inner membrane protein